MKRSHNKKASLGAVLCICIGFYGDQDPASYLHADPDPDPGTKTNEDRCGSGSWSDLKVERS